MAWLRLEPLLAVLFWGGVYPGARLGLQEIPLRSFASLRLLVAASLLWAVAGLRHAQPLTRALWPTLLHAGLAQTAFQLTLIAGLRWTTASNSAVLLATSPLLTAAWLALTGQARLPRQQWLGLGVGLLGVGFVVQGGGSALTWASLGGDLLSLLAAGAWAWYSLVIGPLVGTLGPLRTTAWSMSLATCGVVPVAAGELLTHTWASVSWTAWGGLLYGATLGMVCAMTLWGKAVQRFGVQHTMLYVYLEPVAAVVLAALLLGETLTWWQGLGALLTGAGVALASTATSAG